VRRSGYTDMGSRKRGPPGKPLWVYAYDITLPDRMSRFRSVQDLLDREHREARASARTWSGRVVADPAVTRILIVADSPALDLEVNRGLEAQLAALGATFTVTAPMPMTEAPPSN
jgi:hypothetical protein